MVTHGFYLSKHKYTTGKFLEALKTKLKLLMNVTQLSNILPYLILKMNLYALRKTFLANRKNFLFKINKKSGVLSLVPWRSLKC
jgi:hypothetical protein